VSLESVTPLVSRYLNRGIQNFVILCFLSCCFTFCFSVPKTAIAQTTNPSTSSLFLKAEHAIRTNDAPLTETLLAQLKNHPLYGYLEYQQLKKEIKNNTDQKNIFYKKNISLDHIISYKNTYSDHPLGNALLEFWLNHTAQQEDWTHFLKAWDYTQKQAIKLKNSAHFACHQLYAQYNISFSSTLGEKALALWQQGEPTPACEALFPILLKNKMLTPEILFTKYQFLIEKNNKNNLTIIKKLYNALPLEYKKSAQLYEKLMKQPHLLEEAILLNKISHFKNKIIVSVFKQYAKKKYTPTKTLI